MFPISWDGFTVSEKKIMDRLMTIREYQANARGREIDSRNF